MDYPSLICFCYSVAVGVFVAGLISFLSPCVLPLVPGYVSIISGVGAEQLKLQWQTRHRSIVATNITDAPSRKKVVSSIVVYIRPSA